MHGKPSKKRGVHACDCLNTSLSCKYNLMFQLQAISLLPIGLLPTGFKSFESTDQ